MRAVIFNGELEAQPVLQALSGVARSLLVDAGMDVREFILRDLKVAYCSGCFGCWGKTPGACVIQDAGRDAGVAAAKSDLLVFLTPVTFGGYSSELKKAVDRLIFFLLPYFTTMEGLTRHPPRFDRHPALLALGMQASASEASSRLFHTIVQRNSVNLHMRPAASRVFQAGDSEAVLRTGVESALRELEARP